MRTRTILRRGILPISCLAILTVWAQTGRPQPPVSEIPPVPRVDKEVPPAPPVDKPSPPPPEIKPPTVAPTPAPLPDPTPPPPPTVDDLIKQLELLRMRKAELEKQEKDLVTRLQERMKDQADRLNKLGIIPPGPPVPDIKDTVDAITPLLKSPGSQDKGKQ